MMQHNYTAPEYNKTAFNCPHCGAFAEQKWASLHFFDGDSRSVQNRVVSDFKNLLREYYNNSQAYYIHNTNMTGILEALSRLINGDLYNRYKPLDISASCCARCKKYAYWLEGKMLWPEASIVEMPNPDMPEECQKLYREARSIAGQSPRAAAALLRLCVQQLMPHLGGKGKNINDDIAALVGKNKIVPEVQQALDICRVTGNHAVHPGSIAAEEQQRTIASLFKLLNMIVEKTITAERETKELFSGLPSRDQQSIARRDEKSAPPPDKA